MRRRVVVNLTTGRAFHGVLWAQRGPLLVLRDVTMHDPTHGQPTPVDGEVVVERPRVEFTQIVN